MWEFISDNKAEAAFAIVIAVIGWILTIVYSKKSGSTKTVTDTNVIEGDVNGNVKIVKGDAISAGGDVHVAKNGGKNVVIKNAEIGAVVGDNAKIDKIEVK